MEAVEFKVVLITSCEGENPYFALVLEQKQASEVSVSLKQGCSGDMTLRKAGSIGGQTVNVMYPMCGKPDWSAHTVGQVAGKPLHTNMRRRYELYFRCGGGEASGGYPSEAFAIAVPKAGADVF